MIHKSDPHYKIYIWMQMPNLLIRSKMLTPSDYKKVEDSDDQTEVKDII